MQPEFASARDRHTYVIEFDDKNVVVFTPLEWGEYLRLVDLWAKYPNLHLQIEEYVYENHVISTSYTPEEIEAFAGVIATVVSMVFHVSGVSDLDTFFNQLEEARTVASGLTHNVSAILASVFNYKFEEIEKMTWPDILLRLAQAELVSTQALPQLPLTPIGEEKKTKKDYFNWDRDLMARKAPK